MQALTNMPAVWLIPSAASQRHVLRSTEPCNESSEYAAGLVQSSHHIANVSKALRARHVFGSFPK